ncbi:hypothetical protein ACVWZM_003021 [Bradyrhizobium sp. USDA 4501]
MSLKESDASRQWTSFSELSPRFEQLKYTARRCGTCAL